ncbi:MAG: YraN family protein [Acidobacteriota bacterium]
MRSTVEKGRWAEAHASRHLQSKGYRVVEKNFRCKRGEIDLIVERDGVLCFVEVKARRSQDFGGALLAVDVHKQRRVAAAAEIFLALKPHDGPCRFDVVTLMKEAGRWRVSHLENAYEAGG